MTRPGYNDNGTAMATLRIVLGFVGVASLIFWGFVSIIVYIGSRDIGPNSIRTGITTFACLAGMGTSLFHIFCALTRRHWRPLLWIGIPLQLPLLYLFFHWFIGTEEDPFVFLVHLAGPLLWSFFVYELAKKNAQP